MAQGRRLGKASRARDTQVERVNPNWVLDQRQSTKDVLRQLEKCENGLGIGPRFLNPVGRDRVRFCFSVSPD